MNFIKRLHAGLIIVFALINGFMYYLFLLGTTQIMAIFLTHKLLFLKVPVKLVNSYLKVIQDYELQYWWQLHSLLYGVLLPALVDYNFVIRHPGLPSCAR